MTFSQYLFHELETKDELIHELRQELNTVLSTDHELLNNASGQIEALKQQCMELVFILRATLMHLQQFYDAEELGKITQELCAQHHEESLLG